MCKMSEEKIEETLQTLVRIRPSSESVERMQEKVRRQIAERCRGDQQPFRHKLIWLAPALAASILIAIGLVITFTRTLPVPDQTVPQSPSNISPTCLGSLNAAFESEGMEGIEKLFKEFRKAKKPKPEIKSIDDAVNGDSEKEN